MDGNNASPSHEYGDLAREASLPAFFAPGSVRIKILCCLIAALPLFGEIFHYMSVIRPLWAFSKLFPALSLPLLLRLAYHERFPMMRQVLLSFAWLVMMPSIAAMFYFHEGFFTSVTAQVKLLPILYFFSFLALLLFLQPTLAEIARGFIILGAATAGILIVLWAVIPSSWYSGHYVIGTAPLFSADNRGHRIRMQMYFAIITLFFCYRRAFLERRLDYLLGVAIIFVVTLMIVRTRAMIIGCTGVMLINAFFWVRPLARVLLLVCAPFMLVAMFSTGYLASTFNTSASSGFDIRYITAQKASNFLGDHPVRWIFGVGTLSPTSKDTLIGYFHHFFFLADITWLGIVFEYGLIGALIFTLFEFRGILFYYRLRQRVEDDFLGALNDYLIYVLLISFFYPPTLTPGETATILAIFAYVWRAGGFDGGVSPNQTRLATNVAAPAGA
ncbi:hypothetical protein [Gluconacetobacter asukensis]|uniref:O-antigen ligase n=1 Tax=Gluconacetobacter asukensis TaxID=1017181 RepID=A0A7W4J0V1_9PROT|nr:hypothetical protein [Gluconacetobacter asukensis]MBB2172629.1 hypothetical protein [Gluconacetobacter asukensis]